MALVAGDADVLTGQITYSLDLLAQLRRPVYNLRGIELVEGWQPEDIPAIRDAQEAVRLQTEADAKAKDVADARERVQKSSG